VRQNFLPESWLVGGEGDEVVAATAVDNMATSFLGSDVAGGGGWRGLGANTETGFKNEI
jgi:hypothetical protein